MEHPGSSFFALFSQLCLSRLMKVGMIALQFSHQRFAPDRDDPTRTFWTWFEIVKRQRSAASNGQEFPPTLHPQKFPSLGPDAMTQICSSPLNRSVPSQRLIYNRVPKCASSTMQSVLTLLGLRNGFDYRASGIFWKRLHSTSEERGWMQGVIRENQNLQRPLATDRHFYFVDMERYGSKRVNWINVVRDPIDRLISEFYFLRHPKRWQDQDQRPSQVSTLRSGKKNRQYVVYGTKPILILTET